MKPRELDWYDMFGCVRGFGDAHASLFPKSSIAGEQFAAVASAIQQLRPYAGRSIRLTETGAKRAIVRDALLRRLIAINRTAQVLGNRRHGLRRQFQLPASRRQERLVTAARAFAVVAKVHEAAFIAHGMPVTFIADLLEFADRVTDVSRNLAAEKAERALAQVAIRAAFKSGMVAARTLDVIMANRLVDDAPMLAAWRRARRLRTRPGFRYRPAGGVPANPARAQTEL